MTRTETCACLMQRVPLLSTGTGAHVGAVLMVSHSLGVEAVCRFPRGFSASEVVLTFAQLPRSGFRL